MFINLKDTTFFAVDFGNGPRTILAHGGWTGSWELWCQPFGYLSKTWRTIAYDHRGTGATVAPTDSITFGALVDDVFRILDELEIQSCVLAAESAGAAVAVHAAVQQPQRFEGLILVDGLFHQPPPDGADLFRQGLQTDFAQAIGQFVDACVPESEADSGVIRRWGRQILGRSSPAAALRLLRCMDGVDARPLLARLSQPVLLIHGDQDVLVPLASSQWAASQLARSHLIVLQGAGHVPTVTRPQEVAGAINTYFASLPHHPIE